MALAYDNAFPYDTPLFTYDGAELNLLIIGVRHLLLEDLKGIAYLWLQDDPARTLVL